MTTTISLVIPIHFHALEKEMATHSSVLAWRIPGMGEPSLGLHRVGHDWSDLAAADTLLPKPAKNFPHYKTNEAERQIAIMIYNDTCAAVLGRTSPLARRMMGDALFLSPQAAIWHTNLGSTCNRKLKSHFSIAPIFILIQEREFLFCFWEILLLSAPPPHTTSFTL